MTEPRDDPPSAVIDRAIGCAIAAGIVGMTLFVIGVMLASLSG